MTISIEERKAIIEKCAEVADNAWRYECATAEQYRHQGREDVEALFNSGATVADVIRQRIRKLMEAAP